MKDIGFAVASALAAAVVMWILTTVIVSLATVWQWLVIAGIGVITFVASWMFGRRSSSENGSGIEIGRRIRSRKDVNIEDVSINRIPTADVNVGTDIKSKGTTSIRGITFGKKPDQDDKHRR